MKQTPSAVTQTKSELPLGADGGLGPHFPRPRASATEPASAFLARHGLPHLRTLTRAVPSARNARGKSAGFFSPFRFISPETSPEDPTSASDPHPVTLHHTYFSSSSPSALFDHLQFFPVAPAPAVGVLPRAQIKPIKDKAYVQPQHTVRASRMFLE